MAHYLTGSATGPGALDVMYQALRAHLTGNGWTEHDVISNSGGTRNIVFRGGALDPTGDVRPFLKLQQTSTTNVNLDMFSDWDTTTHAGVNQASGSFTGQDATFVYYFWFDSFGGIIAAKISTTVNRSYAGFLRRGLDVTDMGLTKTTGSLSIGATSLPVASDMTGKMRVGQKVQIMNYAHSSASANASKSEVVTITSIATSSIGCSATTLAFDTGAIVGENCCPGVVFTNATTSIGGATGFLVFNCDGTRTSPTGQTCSATGVVFGTESSVDPGDIDARYGSGIITVACTTALKTGFKGWPRGIYFCAQSAQAVEDLMAAGIYTYLCLETTATGIAIMGPREL